VPADGTVQDVAVLAVNGWWLWAHVVRHDDSVGATPSNFMDAVHLTGLETHAT